SEPRICTEEMSKDLSCSSFLAQPKSPAMSQPSELPETIVGIQIVSLCQEFGRWRLGTQTEFYFSLPIQLRQSMHRRQQHRRRRSPGRRFHRGQSPHDAELAWHARPGVEELQTIFSQDVAGDQHIALAELFHPSRREGNLPDSGLG